MSAPGAHRARVEWTQSLEIGEAVYRLALPLAGATPRLSEQLTAAGKQGFSAPDSGWFRAESAGFVRRTIDTADARIHEFLDPGAVRSLIDDHAAGANQRLAIWSLLNVEHCLRSFCERKRLIRAAA